VKRSFPPVFHEWFIETFPEPSAWLASRLAYGRTAAVMSMVGFILGCVASADVLGTRY
jgi:serine/threonine-protein kinase ATR